jgi:hypothetical protein
MMRITDLGTFVDNGNAGGTNMEYIPAGFLGRVDKLSNWVSEPWSKGKVVGSRRHR